jgi:hypothetical protein
MRTQLYSSPFGLALAFGVVLFAVALYRGLVRSPVLVTPQVYQDLRVKAAPVGAGQFPPDLAWPFYPVRQAGVDLAEVRKHLHEIYVRLWKWPRDTFFYGLHGRRRWWWLFFPIPVTVIWFLLVSGLSAWFCYGVYWLVTTGAATASMAVFGVAEAAMRNLERRRRTRRHARAACMRCFHVTDWPAYRCRGCNRLHQDVRPSRLGLVFRRCGCGMHIPTMASRTAWHLTAVCKRCEQPLPEGTGAIRDIRVPVFGDTSAGKTRFLFAALNSLVRAAGQAGLELTFPDKASQDQADLGLSVIRDGRDTTKTSAAAPVALSCRLGRGRRSELIHLFDAAGEHFRDAQRYDELRFLDDSQGLVYVLDPFAVPAIQDQLTGHNAAVIRQAHAAAGDPEIAYGEVMARLRDGGVPAAAQRLAVIVSKADLLRKTGLELPAGSATIAEWLADSGLYNLVMSSRREFAEVRFYTVASQAAAADRADDPEAPLSWLLRTHGVQLPGSGLAAGPLPGPA